MKQKINSPGNKQRQAQRGYGVVLMMMFVSTTLLVLLSLQSTQVAILGPNITAHRQNAMAQQVANSGLYEARAQIASALDAGTMDPATWSYNGSLAAPTDPTNPTGGTTTIGTYTATLTQYRDNMYLVKVVATVGSATATTSKLMSIVGYALPLGVRIAGRVAGDNSGVGTGPAGDVNNDGYDDVLTGAAFADACGGATCGEASLLLGRSTASWNTLADANGDYSLSTNGKSHGAYNFVGYRMDEFTGYSVYTAGDVNNDGYDDFIIGSPEYDYDGVANHDVGGGFLVMGRSQTEWDALFDSTGTLAFTGFTKANKIYKLWGSGEGDYAVSGYSVATAGNVDGDLYDDFIISCGSCDPSVVNGGGAYLFFGRSQADWDTLTDVNGEFIMNTRSVANKVIRLIGGRTGYRFAGTSVRPAGDLDNDGYADIVIGSPDATEADYNDTTWSSPYTDGPGEAHVVFGRLWSGDSPNDWVSLVNASGDYNFNSMTLAHKVLRVTGRANNDGDAGVNSDGMGRWVSGAGDVNGDNYDDLLLGAFRSDGGGADSGEAYIIMGRPWNDGSANDFESMTTATGAFNMDNASWTTYNTVRFIGRNAGDTAGCSVDTAGDVNKDGYADFLIGARYADGGGGDSGEVYLIFGRSTASWGTFVDASGNFDLDSLSVANNTIRFIGRTANDKMGMSVAPAGDVNGDTYPDFLMGALKNDTGGSDTGQSYLIFGRSQAKWDALRDSSGNIDLDSLLW